MFTWHSILMIFVGRLWRWRWILIDSEDSEDICLSVQTMSFTFLVYTYICWWSWVSCDAMGFLARWLAQDSELQHLSLKRTKTWPYPTYSYIHIRRHELYWHIYLSRLTCRLACNFVSETLKKKYALVACYPSYQWVFWPFWRGWMLCVAVNNIRLIWAAHVRVIERLQMAPLGVGVSSVFTIYVPPTLLSPRRRRQHAPVFW
jgi:hypothetical protein